MKIDLHGRRALVTGSTAGIGFVIAKGLAEAGAAVVLSLPITGYNRTSQMAEA